MFGHSAGACSANIHCISDQSKGRASNSRLHNVVSIKPIPLGLFNRAIILSSSVFASYGSQSINWPLRLAKRLGYNGSDEDRHVLEFLQSADPVRMTEEQSETILPEERGHILIAFMPHVEPYFTDNTIISANYMELSRKAWGNDIDILLGHTADEGLFFLDAINPFVLSQLNLDSMIPRELNLANVEKRKEFVRRIREMYYGTVEPTEDKTIFCQVILPLFRKLLSSTASKFHFQWQGDTLFKHPISRLIQLRQNSNGSGRTYFFRFALDSPTMNDFRSGRTRPNTRGVVHADEVSYYFKHNYGPMPDRQSMEFTAVKRLVCNI